MDVGDHTAASNGGLDECVKLFVATNGELQVTWSDALHTQILRRVASELKHLGGQVLQNCSRVDSSSGTDTALVGHTLFQVAMDTANWKLQPCLG